MILNVNNAVAIDLQNWHCWWPWIPIKINCRSSNGRVRPGNKWRWLYVVQRKRSYNGDTGEFIQNWYRDIRGRTK